MQQLALVPGRPDNPPVIAPGTTPGHRRVAADPLAVERAAPLFRAIGDEARLRLLARLAEGPCCVTDLAVAEGDNLSTVSQRLRVLRAERLLSRRREGRHITYALADAHVIEIVRSALAHVVEGTSAHRPPRPDAAHPQESSS